MATPFVQLISFKANLCSTYAFDSDKGDDGKKGQFRHPPRATKVRGSNYWLLFEWEAQDMISRNGQGRERRERIFHEAMRLHVGKYLP